MSRGTPEQVLKSIVDGINPGSLDSLMPLYEAEAAFATQPGSLYHGLPGIREALSGFIAMKGTLDLKVTRVLEVSDLALATTVWSFAGTGADGQPVKLAAKSPDVLRRQTDGSWRLVIDNPWGTELEQGRFTALGSDSSMEGQMPLAPTSAPAAGVDGSPKVVLPKTLKRPR